MKYNLIRVVEPVMARRKIIIAVVDVCDLSSSSSSCSSNSFDLLLFLICAYDVVVAVAAAVTASTLVVKVDRSEEVFNPLHSYNSKRVL